MKQRAIQLREKELLLFNDNFNAVGTQSAVLAGFAMTSFAEIDLPHNAFYAQKVRFARSWQQPGSTHRVPILACACPRHKIVLFAAGMLAPWRWQHRIPMAFGGSIASAACHGLTAIAKPAPPCCSPSPSSLRCSSSGRAELLRPARRAKGLFCAMAAAG